MSNAGLSAGAWRRWALRAAGSVVVLGAVFWFLPLSEVVAGFGRVPLALFAGVLVAFWAGHGGAALKWWVLTGRAVALVPALRAHFAGLAANLCLPGVAGGDAVRAGLAIAGGGDAGAVAAGSLADRLVDMMALACLAIIGALMVSGQGGGAAVAIQVLGVLAAVFAAIVYVLPALVPAIWRRFPGLPTGGFAARSATALSALGRRPLLLLAMLVLSGLIQALFVYLTMRLAVAVGVDLGLGAWLFAWPLAKILAVLPISLGGLGVREATLAALLAPFGGVAAQVVAAGLVWQAVLWVTGGLGALFLVATGRWGKAKIA